MDDNEPEVTLPSEMIPGEAPGTPLGLDPVEDWSEVDEDYEPILFADDEDESEVDEDLTEEEIEPPEEVADIVLPWASYEIHGRNLNEGTAWQLLASEPYDGTFEVEVDGLTAGASWEFRIRMIDHNGRPSRFSDPMQVSLPTDFTPPPAPEPPFVDENLGFVTLSTDGELTGEKPEDLSHLVLYVQQMHPQGDPEGEPGDPQRMTTFSGAGSWSIGSLLAGVLYRAFLTAVDTTGNESPWSEMVEFTPTVAFDTAALEAELEELNTERLPALEQDLNDKIDEAKDSIQEFRDEWDAEWDPEAITTLQQRQNALENDLITGLQDAYQDAETLAQAAQSNAVSQAAADAQSEYDRLQELAERALSRAGDNILDDPSFETEYWVGEWDGLGGRSIYTGTAGRNGRGLNIDGGSTVDLPLGEVSVEPDQAYRLQVWYRTWASPAVDTLSGTRLRLLNADTGAMLAQSDEFTTGTSWRRALASYQVPETVSAIRAVITVTHGSGRLSLDDAGLQEVGAAAEALRQAEVARQEAQAAHAEAGQARDLAADAYDSASSKSTVHWSLSAPSGTGESGDVWWRYEMDRGRRKVIGEWHWDGGWQPADISVERVPQIDIGGGTFGDLAGSRLQIGSVDADRVLINNTLKAKHVDMVDFTSNQGFIDRAFVSLIQGKMANFDQAIIGGVLLKEDSIALKHLTVGDFENLFTDPLFETWGDSSMWWTGSGGDRLQVLHGTPEGTRLNYSSSSPALTGTARAEFYPHGDRGTQAAPGERFFIEYEVRAGGNAEVRIAARFREARMGTIYRTSSASWAGGGGWTKVQFEVTAPDNHPQMLSYDIQFRNAGDGNFAQIRNVRVRRSLAGRMVINGLLQASTGELQQLFFDTAVGNAISLGIANILEINADRIKSNSWTGQVLTGPVVQSHTASNRGWKIRPTNGLQMWTNSGVETVRLNGTDNYLAGRIHAGVNANSGIVLDYGTVFISRGWTDEEEPPEIIQEHQTQFIEFQGVPGNLYDPQIYVDSDTGGLSISPGRKVGTPSGSGDIRLWGRTRANRLISRRLEVPTSSAVQPGGLYRDGPRTRLMGRTPDRADRADMLATTNTGSIHFESGRTTRSGSVTWADPVPNGTRRPVASVNSNSGAFDNMRTFEVTTYSSVSSGFNYRIRRTSGSGGNNYVWLRTISAWH